VVGEIAKAYFAVAVEAEGAGIEWAEGAREMNHD